VLGAEMRSTGESMGIDFDPYLAYYKAQLGAGVRLPDSGAVRLIGDGLEEVAAQFSELGFTVLEGAPPDGADYGLLIDTAGTGELRRALEEGIPLITTAEAAVWSGRAIAAARGAVTGVHALQSLHAQAAPQPR